MPADDPGERDVRVDSVFSPAMFGELAAEMEKVGIEGVEETRALWASDFSVRTIIKGFMKDRSLGAPPHCGLAPHGAQCTACGTAHTTPATAGDKRLASMPDRMTNTINTLDQGTVCRPTIINCYAEEMGSVESWWEQWR